MAGFAFGEGQPLFDRPLSMRDESRFRAGTLAISARATAHTYDIVGALARLVGVSANACSRCCRQFGPTHCCEQHDLPLPRLEIQRVKQQAGTLLVQKN